MIPLNDNTSLLVMGRVSTDFMLSEWFDE